MAYDRDFSVFNETSEPNSEIETHLDESIKDLERKHRKLKKKTKRIQSSLSCVYDSNSKEYKVLKRELKRVKKKKKIIRSEIEKIRGILSDYDTRIGNNEKRLSRVESLLADTIYEKLVSANTKKDVKSILNSFWGGVKFYDC